VLAGVSAPDARMVAHRAAGAWLAMLLTAALLTSRHNAARAQPAAWITVEAPPRCERAVAGLDERVRDALLGRPIDALRGRAPASLGEERERVERSSARAVDEPGALAVSPQSPASRAQPRARGRAPTSLREELELLARVQAALRRGDAATALRDLDQHRTLDEQLLGERAAARVLALCSLGRKAEGRRVRAELMQREPTSPHRSALERACVEAEPSD
jgi:hypothetical protein